MPLQQKDRLIIRALNDLVFMPFDQYKEALCHTTSEMIMRTNKGLIRKTIDFFTITIWTGLVLIFRLIPNGSDW